MTSADRITLLHSFLNGTIEFADFDDRLGDILFELCQTPEMTEDKAALSRIQLAIHELEDGTGEKFDVYMAVQGALDILEPPVGVPERAYAVEVKPPADYIIETGVSRPRAA